MHYVMSPEQEPVKRVGICLAGNFPLLCPVVFLNFDKGEMLNVVIYL